MTSVYEFIQGIPKAELHIHIEGSLTPKRLLSLAQKNKIDLAYQSIEDIQKAYQFSNLQSFLDIYYQGAKVLIDEQDFYDLAMDYFEMCAQDNICHTEIFFDPQTHTQRGVAFETVVNGLDKACFEAKKRWGISSCLIACFLRHLDEKDAFDTFNEIVKHKDKIIGVGLDSSEKGHPPEKFVNVFNLARVEGFQLVAHAGEEADADYIWQAIHLLKIQRIDHGVQSVHDERLMAFLAETQLPLTVCPFSNIKLKVYQSMQQHPILKMLEQGLCVTVNSDDPSYFGGFLNENYKGLVESLGLTCEQVKVLAENSIKASFLPELEKQAYLSEISEYAEDAMR